MDVQRVDRASGVVATEYFKRVLRSRFVRAGVMPLIGCLKVEPSAACRFSLRALFAAMTFFAVYFGVLRAMKIF
jgi:hypothetical protein